MIINLWKKPKFALVFSLFLFFVFAALFLKVTDEVWLEQEFFLFDRLANNLMADNHLLEPYDWRFFLAITYLGNSVVLTGLTLLLAGLFWFYHHKPESVLFLGGFVMTSVSVILFKLLTERIRPDGASLLNETSGAFPSGHAALAFYFYGFLGYALSRKVTKRSRGILIFAGGLSLAALIGISRIYLNVHWVSDVLAGFALAAAVLSLCIAGLEMEKLRVPI